MAFSPCMITCIRRCCSSVTKWGRRISRERFDLASPSFTGTSVLVRSTTTPDMTSLTTSGGLINDQKGPWSFVYQLISLKVSHDDQMQNSGWCYQGKTLQKRMSRQKIGRDRRRCRWNQTRLLRVLAAVSSWEWTLDLTLRPMLRNGKCMGMNRMFEYWSPVQQTVHVFDGYVTAVKISTRSPGPVK